MKKTILITQARTGSTRLPQKILLPVLGKPMLIRFLERVMRAQTLDHIIVATTTAAADDQVEQVVNGFLETEASNRLSVFRGSEEDVLDRYYQAAKLYRTHHAESDLAIVRVTSDCPLIDPAVIDLVVRRFHQTTCDYCANRLSEAGRTFPHGMDVEVFSWAALQKAWQEADSPFHREHVTPYIHQHPDRFVLHNVPAAEDHSHLRMTVDYPEDYQLTKTIFAHFEERNNPHFTMEDLITYYYEKGYDKMEGSHEK